jgi:hypothetical protein
MRQDRSQARELIELAYHTISDRLIAFLKDRTTRKMLQIKLTRSDLDHRWSVSLLDQENIFWSSPETFDSPDTAYYRAIGEYVLQKWDCRTQKPHQAHATTNEYS